ncbi:uncharacterized protein LOC112554875 [Pomacea canaliculata]|uniref:uncharacterized protein LOC112554875 n=1 Tax=Pomacea canaliculata TaxID=400727 RepID=UPI000D7332E6|nr:uncharacterized protein LOC112554875 [Pomacea canaliculata]
MDQRINGKEPGERKGRQSRDRATWKGWFIVFQSLDKALDIVGPATLVLRPSDQQFRSVFTGAVHLDDSLDVAALSTWCRVPLEPKMVHRGFCRVQCGEAGSILE